KNDAVRNVQVYDAEKNTWRQATPIPGTPVFGHAGALLDDSIVYVDGAYKNSAANSPRYIASNECWIGKIDHRDLSKIQWTKLPNHPGNARYRIADGAFAKGPEDLLFWRHRQSLQLRWHRLRRAAVGTITSHLRLEPAHK